MFTRMQLESARYNDSSINEYREEIREKAVTLDDNDPQVSMDTSQNTKRLWTRG